jgi:hypothetical protein
MRGIRPTGAAGAAGTSAARAAARLLSSLAVAAVVSSLGGCARWDTGNAARTSAAALLACAEEQVQVTPVADFRYRGEGCGRRVQVVCTAAALEPTCYRQGRVETSGGESVASAPEAGTARVREAEVAAPMESGALTEDAVDNAALGEVSEPSAGEVSEGVRATAGSARVSTDAGAADAAAIEVRIRAGLDARREDVLACVGRERVAVRVTYDGEGAVRITLQGALEGSPEEGCVRAALEGVRVPGTGASGAVVHLVR